MNVCILQTDAHPVLFQHFDVVTANLKAREIAASWGHGFPGGGRAVDQLFIVHNHDEDYPFVAERRLLGYRTINRQEQLVLAMEAGATVARWTAPESKEKVAAFSEKVGSESLIYKSDSASRRGAERLLRAGEQFPADARPDADVVMELPTEDPTTYKVDVFYDTVVGAFALPTKRLDDPDFNAPPARPSYFLPPAEIYEACRSIGKRLLPYGAGYISIDLMRRGDSFVIIGINTCDVGLLNSWTRWPAFPPAYAAAIRSLLESGAHIPTMAESTRATEVLRSARKESGEKG